jgi:predicted ATPase/DNA-binding winged helix-turn-helix (wHTH) protein
VRRPAAQTNCKKAGHPPAFLLFGTALAAQLFSGQSKVVVATLVSRHRCPGQGCAKPPWRPRSRRTWNFQNPRCRNEHAGLPTQGQNLIYESGQWQVDLERRQLKSRGVAVPIGARAFEIIEVLVQSASELVTKDDLMQRVWPGAIVEENTLQVHIGAIRRALGQDRGMLKTASGRGYRLLGDWSIRRQTTAAPPIGLQRIRTSGEAPGSNFPLTVTCLVGRSAAVQRVQDLVSAYRVVTLTGPGGIGKTSLAVKVGRRVLGEFSDGGWLVELASLSDPDLVPSTVAHVLGLKIGGEISGETVARAVGGQNLLLVLDNCEHVIDAVATLVEMFVRLCPRTTLLATSREILRIDGEHVYNVLPLEVPAEDEKGTGNILDHSAVELFIARGKGLDADFSSHPHDLPAIASICRHLDGIPLAIEFAAARAATLGIGSVAAGLRDRFALLTSGRRTAVPRHRTLRATLDWSYGLLTEPEQRLLRHLAIFPAGFTLSAAAAVINDVDGAALDIENGISSLVSKSLVALDRSASTARWSLLETIRAYALEKLTACAEAGQAARRHAEFYRDLFAPGSPDSQLQPPGEDMQRLGREIDNVRAALDWSFSPAGDTTIGVILTAAYVPAWLHSALPAECRERTERAVQSLTGEMDLSPLLQMQLYFAAGLMPAYTMSPVEPGKIALTKALALAEQLGDIKAQFQILWALWVLNSTAGECRVAQIITDRLSLTARRIGEQSVALIADRLQGFVLQQMGEHRKAQRCFERVIEHYVAPTDERITAWGQFDQRVLARAMLARALWLQGYAEQAAEQARISLEEAQVTSYQLSIGEALRVALCQVALMTGDLVTAEWAVTMLIDVATSRNAPFWGISGRCLRGKLLVMRGEFAAGSALLRAELDACERTGWPIWYPEFMGVLTEGLIGLGRIPEALVTIDQALASADRGGERYYYPELLRIKGEVLLRQATDQSVQAAEESFNQAAVLAREQEALFWELRIALSLARLRVTQGRDGEAREILLPVYDRFTEGFETADMRAARAMLDELPS